MGKTTAPAPAPTPEPTPAPTPAPSPAPEKAATVKARVLIDCTLGKAGSVAEVTEEQAKAHAHEIDTHPDAVAYAEAEAAEKNQA